MIYKCFSFLKQIKKLTKTVAHRKQTGKKIMKKLIIIAVVSSFLFISCAKVEPSVNPLKNTSGLNTDPIPPAPHAPQRYVITNTETNSGIVEYRVVYTDANLVVHNVPLEMGQSITVCLNNSADVRTNFGYTIVAIGLC